MRFARVVPSRAYHPITVIVLFLTEVAGLAEPDTRSMNFEAGPSPDWKQYLTYTYRINTNALVYMYVLPFLAKRNICVHMMVPPSRP